MNKNKPIKKVVIQNSESEQESDLPEIKPKATKKELLQSKKIAKKVVQEDQEETPVVNKKKQAPKDDSSVSKDKPKKQLITNTGPVRKSSVEKKKNQKKQSSEEEESSPEQPTKKIVATKPIAKQPAKNVKKDMSEEEESEEVQQKVTKSKVKEQPKKQPPKKAQTSQQSEEQQEVKPKKVVKPVQNKKNVDSDEQSEDIIVDKKKKPIVPQQKQKAKKQTSSEEESQEQNTKNKNVIKKVISPKNQPLPSKNVKKVQLEQQEQQEKVPSRKSSKDIKKKVKRVVEQSDQEQPIKVPAKKVQSEIKTRKTSQDSLKVIGKKVQVQEDEKGQFEACVMQLSFNAYDQDIRDHFQQCGNILNVKLLTKPDGKSKGIAFVKFGLRSQLQKALELNGSDLMGRPIKVQQAMKRQNNGNNNFGNNRPNNRDNNRGGNNFNSNRDNKFKDNSPAVIDNPNLFIGGLSFNSTQDSMKNFFGQCGTVIGARIVTDRQTGKPRGFGYVEFASVEQAKKAYTELNGQQLDGRNIRIDATQPRNRPQGGGDRGFSGGRGQSRNPGNSQVDLSIDDKNAKSGAMGTFQGKKIIL